MTDHDRFLDLCAAFAAGRLSAEERRALDEHLANGCAECESALAAFQEGAGALASTAPRREPPAALKRRVLKAIEVKGAGGQKGRLFALAGWAVAAVLAIVAFLAWDGGSAVNGVPPPFFRAAPLKPASDAFAGLEGYAFHERNTGRAWFQLENYRAPAGKDYELWAIRDGKPVSLGVARADASGKVAVVINAGAADVLAVSLEEAGGSRTGAPTTVVSLAALG